LGERSREFVPALVQVIRNLQEQSEKSIADLKSIKGSEGKVSLQSGKKVR
jgi:antitoxin component HigA of HigAB toxin-antitoxin module